MGSRFNSYPEESKQVRRQAAFYRTPYDRQVNPLLRVGHFERALMQVATASWDRVA
jgi:hypothetical protein